MSAPYTKSEAFCEEELAARHYTSGALLLLCGLLMGAFGVSFWLLYVVVFLAVVLLLRAVMDDIGAGIMAFRNVFGSWSEFVASWKPDPIDERTGRLFGDHGTAAQAMDWAFHHYKDEEGYWPPDDEKLMFLQKWYEGDAIDEWPEYYDWLKDQPE